MLSCQRDSVLLPPELHYLNLAYMAPLHASIRAAGKTSVTRQADPTSLGLDAMFDEVDEIRSLYALLVGAHDASRVAVMPSASYGLATAAKNVPLAPEQNMIVVGDQFPSNFYPWARSCSSVGAELRVVRAPTPTAGTSRGVVWNERLLSAIDSRTAVVAVPNAHWSDGTLFDLRSLRTRTREVGAALVVDGTQSVGAIPIDVEELGLDALISAAYKTLLCPYGTAFGYFGAYFDDGEPIEETWLARKNSTDFANLVDYQEEYRPGAARFEAGGRCNFITMPMVKAALELLLEWTPAAISDYCSSLTSDLPSRLLERGFWIEDVKHRSPQLFGIRVPQTVDVEQCFKRLQDRKVAVSLRGETLRISPHLHNTTDDVHALTEVLYSS